MTREIQKKTSRANGRSNCRRTDRWRGPTRCGNESNSVSKWLAFRPSTGDEAQRPCPSSHGLLSLSNVPWRQNPRQPGDYQSCAKNSTATKTTQHSAIFCCSVSVHWAHPKPVTALWLPAVAGLLMALHDAGTFMAFSGLLLDGLIPQSTK